MFCSFFVLQRWLPLSGLDNCVVKILRYELTSMLSASLYSYYILANVYYNKATSSFFYYQLRALPFEEKPLTLMDAATPYLPMSSPT